MAAKLAFSEPTDLPRPIFYRLIQAAWKFVVHRYDGSQQLVTIKQLAELRQQAESTIIKADKQGYLARIETSTTSVRFYVKQSYENERAMKYLFGTYFKIYAPCLPEYLEKQCRAMEADADQMERELLAKYSNR